MWIGFVLFCTGKREQSLNIRYRDHVGGMMKQYGGFGISNTND
jgi:hypothetical protein